MVKLAVHSAEGCCTATTMALLLNRSFNMELETIKRAHGIASEKENMCETLLEKILSSEGRNCLVLSLEGDEEMMTVTQSEYRC